jgi:hypothetical protein
MSNSQEHLHTEASQNPKTYKTNSTEVIPQSCESCLSTKPRKSNNPLFLFGLIERRECWMLTWTGILLTMAALTFVTALWIRGLFGFLSITNPIGGEFLVVEAWIPAYAYREVVTIFAKGGYKKIIAAGVIQENEDTGELREFFGEGKLIGLGIPRHLIVTAMYNKEIQRDRTLHSAMAVKGWLWEQGLRAASIDVVTIGTHARRSRLLYEKALGSNFKVGVFAIRDRGFDPNHWWQSSEGVRTVIGETIAYLYVRIFFSLSLNT